MRGGGKGKRKWMSEWEGRGEERRGVVENTGMKKEKERDRKWERESKKKNEDAHYLLPFNMRPLRDLLNEERHRVA